MESSCEKTTTSLGNSDVDGGGARRVPETLDLKAFSLVLMNGMKAAIPSEAAQPRNLHFTPHVQHRSL